MEVFHKVKSTISRVERVVMLTLVRLLLLQLQRSLSLTWITALFFTMHILCLLFEFKISKSHVFYRLLSGISRLSLYVCIHSVMKLAFDSKNNPIINTMQGVLVLSLLSLLVHVHLKGLDTENFCAQTVYSFAISAENLLLFLQKYRIFLLVILVFLIGTPVLRKRLSNRYVVVDVLMQAIDLVSFDSFTDVFFRETGDSFSDISLILFSFLLLFHLQNQFEVLGSMQQYTMWRVANELIEELTELKMPDGLIIAGGVALTMFSENRLSSWLSPLSLLVVVSTLLNVLNKNFATMGSLDSLPVLLSIAVVIVFVSDKLQDVKNVK